MATNRGVFPVLPTGEQPAVERVSAETAVADTFAGRGHVEWDDAARVTPLGQLPFFIEYMKQGGLFDGWVSGCRCISVARTPRASGTFWGQCCCRCWPATGAMRI